MINKMKNSRSSMRAKVIAMSMIGMLLLGGLVGLLPNTVEAGNENNSANNDTVVLRVCNWEEYIDLGEWDDDEVIDLDNGDIFGENPLYEDFEEWYLENYGVKVEVEYSCFGTNEELYNMLTIGDVYDLVCPSDYMIMKLMSEDKLVQYSDSFFDADNEENYYVRGASPFIQQAFEENEINGEAWKNYAACYMWGVTGMLYNPEEVPREDAMTWQILNNPDYCRQVTVKDNVRDTMFAGLGALKSELLLSEEFVSSDDYSLRLKDEMNDVSEETLDVLQNYLQQVRKNVYSFESDSGKADMITGKVLANLQWSGDAVYAMDQAEEDDYYLEFAIPYECTNLWFDGWVMLKSGIGESAAKKQAAEAFVNYLSMPENAVRNMYYIGYTSAITGGEYDDTVFQYIDWTYSAEEDEDSENLVEYNVGYYFTGEEDNEDYVICTTEDQTRRQLYAQYPPKDAIDRSAIMWYFDADANARVNQMWINVRCFNAKSIPVWLWVVIGAAFAVAIYIIVRTKLINRSK